MGRPAVLAVRLLRHVRLRDVGRRLRRLVLGLRLRRHLCRHIRALRLRRPHRLPAAIRQRNPRRQQAPARRHAGRGARPADANVRRGQPRHRRPANRSIPAGDPADRRTTRRARRSRQRLAQGGTGHQGRLPDRYRANRPEPARGHATAHRGDDRGGSRPCSHRWRNSTAS